MASIHKRGKKYLVTWRDPDGTQRTRTCPDRATADDLKRDVESTRALGQRWEPRAAALAPELGVAAEFYLKHRATRKRGNTLVGDDQACAQFMDFLKAKNPRQRRWTVEHLNLDTLTEFDADLRARTAPRTANARVLCVRRWWAWLCIRPDYKPFMDPPPEARILDLPQEVWAPPNAPSWAEMDSAIHAAEIPWVKDLCTVLRYTGLRQGQGMRLLWSDLNLETGMLTIRPELGKTKQERAGRVIPVTAHLIRYLKARTPEGERTGWLVAPHKVQRKASSWELDAPWEAAGVPEAVWKGHPGHAFRYGFTSGLAALKADYEASEYLVGHAVPGARAHYLDPTWALALREAVDLIPAIGRPKVKRISQPSRNR